MTAKQSTGLRNRLVKIAVDFPRRVAAMQRTLTIEGAAGVIAQSPVRTGQLRNGWDLGIGEPSDYSPPGGSETYPNNALARINAKARSAPDLSPHVITNNVAHAPVIETGGFVPTDPGPSKGVGKKGSRRRARTEGVVLVSGGFHTGAPQGMLVSGIAAISRKLHEFEASGLPKAGKG